MRAGTWTPGSTTARSHRWTSPIEVKTPDHGRHQEEGDRRRASTRLRILGTAGIIIWGLGLGLSCKKASQPAPSDSQLAGPSLDGGSADGAATVGSPADLGDHGDASTSADAGNNAEVSAPSGPRFARLVITSTLEAATVELVGPEEGLRLAQVVKRTLVWWMNLSRDLWPNDRIDIVYELRGAEEPLVHAIWLDAHKLGREYTAALYLPKGAPFPRWYTEDGREVELRLTDSPIASYEQVTSLLSDGRGHRGIDFKTPVGTVVVAPFSGTVVRKNWATRRNGNCLEILNPSNGYHAFFLHLDRVERGIRAGVRVRKGQRLALTGNTGRSSAPHLHYQMELNGRIVDPFRVHKTWRSELPSGEKAELQKLLAKYGAMRLRST